MPPVSVHPFTLELASRWREGFGASDGTVLKARLVAVPLAIVATTSLWQCTSGDQNAALERRGQDASREAAKEMVAELKGVLAGRSEAGEHLQEALGEPAQLRRAFSQLSTPPCFGGSESRLSQGAFRGPVGGEVTGDEDSDLVYVFGLPQAGDCAYYVLVREQTRLLVTNLRARDLREALEDALLPQVIGDVDGRPGREILIRLSGEGTGAFYVMYSSAGGQLRRLTKEQGSAMFVIAGSAGYGARWGCVEPGTIFVTSFEAKDGRRYVGTIETLRLKGRVFRLVERERFSVPYGEKGLKQIASREPGSTACARASA